MKSKNSLWISIGIFFLPVIYRVILFTPANRSITDSLTNVFGYIGVEYEKGFMINFISWFMPQLAVIFLWGEYFNKNLVANSSIVLIRSSSRIKVLLTYLKELIVNVVKFVTIQIMIVCVCAILFGYKINFEILFFSEIISIYMYMIMVVLVINFFSLYIKTTYATSIVIIIECVQAIFIIKNIHGKELLPMYGIIYELASSNGEAIHMVINNTIWLVLFIVTFIILFKKKKDIL